MSKKEKYEKHRNVLVFSSPSLILSFVKFLFIGEFIISYFYELFNRFGFSLLSAMQLFKLIMGVYRRFLSPFFIAGFYRRFLLDQSNQIAIIEMAKKIVKKYCTCL